MQKTLQTIVDNWQLPDRQLAALLNVTRHQLRELREQAEKIVGPHVRCTVSDGAGI